MRNLVWFRSDLRLRDNTALWEACENAARGPKGGVVGVFTICPEQWRRHDWAPARVDLLLRTLEALSRDLAWVNIPVRVLTVPRFDQVPDALAKLAKACACQALYLNREYEWNEARRDEAVAARFLADEREVFFSDDQVVLAPGDVLTQKGGFYTVFTPFRRAWTRRLLERGQPAVLGAPRRQTKVPMAPDPVPISLPGFDGQRLPELWPAGEAEALTRLRRFISDRAGDYATLRDVPGVDGTSSLSPYLNLGSLSPRQCLNAALDANGGELEGGNPGLLAWMGELAWREFYKHLLVGFPRLSKGQAFRPAYDAVPWADDERSFRRWCDGLTGYPLVDAGMRQLATTGWMHNRVRMVTAMFLTKHLLIDWRWGERFFMQHLVDGDLACNNGGWQWSASTGTDAQPYFRVFNPWSQSRRFDPDGVYVRRYVPELREVPASALHDPKRLQAAVKAHGLNYPSPVVDHKLARARAIETFKTASKAAS